MNFYKKKVFKNLSCLWFFHLQDFYVADASENQVFLAVAHSARTTHLYISDTSGTKYSLSMERVLYFSQNTTSAWLRWQMITLHVYFFKKLKWFSSLLTYIVINVCAGFPLLPCLTLLFSLPQWLDSLTLTVVS